MKWWYRGRIQRGVVCFVFLGVGCTWGIERGMVRRV